MQYTNPIIKGFHPDPSVCYDGSDYYLVCSSFEFFPSLPIFKSKDLVNWEQINAVIENEAYLDLTKIKNSYGLFAPSIRYHEGTYFVVCTNVTQGNFICHTTNPAEGWSAPVWIETPMGIDPSLTFVDDKCYYQLAVMTERTTIHQGEINPFTGEILTELREISTGCGGRDVEAPHIFEKDDWFYLVLAEGGTREGHMVTIQRSKSVWGPFEGCPHNPVLTNRNVRTTLQAVGHADFFADHQGNWWTVALATRPVNHFTLLGRETILLPVEWVDGWPVVNGNGTGTEFVETDRIEGEQATVDGQYNYFTKERIRTLGLPVPFEIVEDTVRVKNYPATIKIPKTSPVSFLSVSQTDFALDFSTELDLAELAKGNYGGLIYKDDSHYCKFGLEIKANQSLLFIEKQVADMHNRETIALEIAVGKISLNIKGDETTYHVGISDSKTQTKLSSSILTRHFTSEAADSPFTGVQIGIFTEAETGETAFAKTLLRYH